MHSALAQPACRGAGGGSRPDSRASVTAGAASSRDVRPSRASASRLPARACHVSTVAIGMRSLVAWLRGRPPSRVGPYEVGEVASLLGGADPLAGGAAAQGKGAKATWRARCGCDCGNLTRLRIAMALNIFYTVAEARAPRSRCLPRSAPAIGLAGGGGIGLAEPPAV